MSDNIFIPRLFRFPVLPSDHLKLQVRRASSQNETLQVAELININTKGLGFRSSTSLQKGEDFLIKLTFKRWWRRQEVLLPGIIKRKVAIEDYFEYGIEIQKVSLQYEKLLGDFLSSLPSRRIRSDFSKMFLEERDPQPEEMSEVFTSLIENFEKVSKKERKDMLNVFLALLKDFLRCETVALYASDPKEEGGLKVFSESPQIKDKSLVCKALQHVHLSGLKVNLSNEKYQDILPFEGSSFLALPLRNSDDEVIGVLAAKNKKNESSFQYEDEKKMHLILPFISEFFRELNSQGVIQYAQKGSAGSRRVLCLIGRCSEIANIRSKIPHVKNVNTPILISGERGSGKTLVAKIVHFEGVRSQAPFQVLDARELKQSQNPESFFNIEFWQKLDGGTLYLKNVEDLSFSLQEILLKNLKGGSVHNIRLISSSSLSPSQLTQQKSLSSKWNEYSHQLIFLVPPLREHHEDIPALVGFWLKQICEAQGFLPKNLTPEAMSQLSNYSWPGNLNELKACLLRLVMYHTSKHVISQIDLRGLPLFEGRDEDEGGATKDAV